MCQAHPAPRCMKDADSKFESAKTALEVALFNQSNSSDPLAMDNLVKRKQKTLQQRQREFDVAVTTSARTSRITLKAEKDGTLKHPLTREERAKHQRIVERAEQLRENPDQWVALRRERYIRVELAKYEEARRKFGAVSMTQAFPHPALLIHALEALPTFPHNKTGGGRELTKEELEAINQAKHELAKLPSDERDYLPEEKVDVRRAVVRPGARKPGLGNRIKGEREPAQVVKEAVTPRPAIKSLGGTQSRKLPTLPPLPSRPTVKSTPPVTTDSADETYVSPPPKVVEEQAAPAPVVAKPKAPVPVFSPRPQELQERSVFDPEPQPRRNLVNRILGKRG